VGQGEKTGWVRERRQGGSGREDMVRFGREDRVRFGREDMVRFGRKDRVRFMREYSARFWIKERNEERVEDKGGG